MFLAILLSSFMHASNNQPARNPDPNGDCEHEVGFPSDWVMGSVISGLCLFGNGRVCLRTCDVGFEVFGRKAVGPMMMRRPRPGAEALGRIWDAPIVARCVMQA